MNYFSFIVSLLVVLYVLYKFVFSRIEITWERTSWLKKIIGIRFWWYDKYHTGATGRGFDWGKQADNEFEVSHKRNGERK